MHRVDFIYRPVFILAVAPETSASFVQEFLEGITFLDSRVPSTRHAEAFHLPPALQIDIFLRRFEWIHYYSFFTFFPFRYRSSFTL